MGHTLHNWLSSIHSRLLLLALFCLLPVSLVVVHSALETHRITSDKAVDSLATLAAFLHNDLEESVAAATQLLAALAQSPQGLLDGSPACHRRLTDLTAAFPDYGNLFTTDTQGQVICSANPIPGPLDLGDRDYIRNALAGQPPRPGTVIRGRIIGRMVLPLATALHDEEGRIIGSVAATIALGRFLASPVVTAGLSSATLANVTTTLWSEDGTVLARAPDPEGLAGSQAADSELFGHLSGRRAGDGTVEIAGLDGTSRWYAFSSFGPPEARILLSVGLPSELLFAEIEALYQYTLLLLAAVLFIALALAWLVAERSVRRPVIGLVRAAGRVADGHLDTRIGSLHGASELTALADHFDRMVESLQQYEQERSAAQEAISRAKHDLELQVRERTAQLKEASVAATERAARLERQSRELAILNELTALLQSCHTLDETRPIIARSLQDLFIGSAGTVYLFRESGNALEISTRWGGEGHNLADSFAPDDCWSLRLGHLWSYQPGTRTPACCHVHGDVPGAYLCAPMLAEGKTLGILHIRCIDDCCQDDWERLVEATAARLALALANIKLREALRNLAIRDTLTGLYNRRFVEEIFEHEVLRCRRSDQPLSVLMVDVDHFKRFNDTHGHEAGDVVLRSVGNLLKEQFRASDLPCRLGGEEFLVILPETETEVAVERAERLRRAIEGLALFHQGKGLGNVTVSIGVATWPQPVGDHNSLIDAADVALYNAKHMGRNRISVAGEPEPSERG